MSFRVLNGTHQQQLLYTNKKLYPKMIAKEAHHLFEVDFFSSHFVSYEKLQYARWLGFTSSLVALIEFYRLPSSEKFPNHVYFTAWGTFISVIYFSLVCFLTKFYKKGETHVEKITRLERLTHIVYQVAVGIEFVVCIIYWVLLVPTLSKSLERFPEYWWGMLLNSLSTHLIIPIHIWTEAIFNRVCFTKKDALVFIPLIGVMYTTLNFCWFKQYGKPIYPPLDWKTSRTPMFLGSAFALVGLGCYLGYLIWLVKAKKANTTKAKMN